MNHTLISRIHGHHTPHIIESRLAYILDDCDLANCNAIPSHCEIFGDVV